MMFVVQFILLIFGFLMIFECMCDVMLCDWGLWDGDFNVIIVWLCECLLQIVYGEGMYECVLL